MQTIIIASHHQFLKKCEASLRVLLNLEWNTPHKELPLANGCTIKRVKKLYIQKNFKCSKRVPVNLLRDAM